ncbi:MAG: SDR family oxidoreductase, partial [Burkholderiales bacterium]
VYGASSDEVGVDSPTDPRTFYSISKMRGEEHVARLFSRMDTYIIRCGNVYGYGKSMRFDSVINRFMFDANCSRRITINGSGKQHRSFIHIDRVVNLLGKLVQAPIESGPYNLVEDTFEINYVADTVKEIYPDLETIFVNQHLQLRELKVKPDPVVNGLIEIEMRTLKQALADFRQVFTF